VKILLPNKQVVSRAINQFYLLELQAAPNIQMDSATYNGNVKSRPSPRTIGVQARERIALQLGDGGFLLSWNVSWRCHQQLTFNHNYYIM